LTNCDGFFLRLRLLLLPLLLLLLLLLQLSLLRQRRQPHGEASNAHGGKGGPVAGRLGGGEVRVVLVPRRRSLGGSPGLRGGLGLCGRRLLPLLAGELDRARFGHGGVPESRGQHLEEGRGRGMCLFCLWLCFRGGSSSSSDSGRGSSGGWSSRSSCLLFLHVFENALDDLGVSEEGLEGVVLVVVFDVVVLGVLVASSFVSSSSFSSSSPGSGSREEGLCEGRKAGRGSSGEQQRGGSRSGAARAGVAAHVFFLLEWEKRVKVEFFEVFTPRFCRAERTVDLSFQKLTVERKSRSASFLNDESDRSDRQRYQAWSGARGRR